MVDDAVLSLCGSKNEEMYMVEYCWETRKDNKQSQSNIRNLLTLLTLKKRYKVEFAQKL